jgi:hypothetical protein
VDDLYTAVRKVNPRVGYATVYRTLKLLKECGLAAERHFDDGQARYEPTEETAQHHDHIICERCGKIVEFNSEELEKQQERIARFLGSKHANFNIGMWRRDALALIGESVKLTRRGRSFLGLCPFHKEKSPSFHVHSERGQNFCSPEGKCRRDTPRPPGNCQREDVHHRQSKRPGNERPRALQQAPPAPAMWVARCWRAATATSRSVARPSARRCP